MTKSKIIITALFFSICCISLLKAQQNAPFKDYEALQKALTVNLFEQQKKVDYGTPKKLKEATSNLKENTQVKIKQLKPSHKKLSPPSIAAKSTESVLMICKYYFPQKANTVNMEVIATGIVLSKDGICATNYHVLREYIDSSLKVNQYDSLIFVANSKGEAMPIEKIVSYNKDGDIAIFKINPLEQQLCPIPLGEDTEVGAAVFALSHPDGFLYYFTKGMVARNSANNKIGPFGNRMEITADYAKGSSGGPIIDEYGNLAGMVSSTRSIYFTDRPQINLQLVIKKAIPVQTFKHLTIF